MAQGKLVIGFYRQRVEMDAATAQTMLDDLGAAFGHIYNRNASHLSFSDLYGKAYNMVLHKKGDMLYEGVKHILLKHLEKSQALISQAPDEQFLQVLVREWTNHELAFSKIEGLLLYMDKEYCRPQKKLCTYDAAIVLFRDIIINAPSVLPRITSLILSTIDLERRGSVIDLTLLHDTLYLVQAMDKRKSEHLLPGHGSTNTSASTGDSQIGSSTVYCIVFEKSFLEASAEFYKSESLLNMSQFTCSEYLQKVEKRFAEEIARVERCCSPTTQQPLIECLEKYLIGDHAQALMAMESSGLSYLLEQSKLDDLKRMYSLFGRIPSCADALRDFVENHVNAKGLLVLQNQSDQRSNSSFVSDLLNYKDKLDEINQVAFKNDKNVSKKIRCAFESFINGDNRSASYLANYVDEILRSNEVSDSEMENKLEKIMAIYRYLSDKDVFENFYRKLLCKRLLDKRTSSLEHEHSMISRLKTESGYQFTSKLEGMFNDIRSSDHMQREFADSQSRSENAVDVNITLLTSGIWPIPTVPSCKLPSVLDSRCRSFEEFYLKKNNRRKLLWLSQLGNVDMKADFPLGWRELNVTTYQSSLLMLFNDSATISLSEFRRATRIPELELKRQLLSMCTSKMRLLIKSSKSKTIEEDETFSVNVQFTSPKRRLKVLLVSAKEVQGSAQNQELNGTESEIPAEVLADRKYLIDAAIVRTMKARRTSSHNDLVVEVTKQLSSRFTPTPMIIKKQIESLIEREYMQRDSEDSRMYSYIA